MTMDWTATRLTLTIAACTTSILFFLGVPLAEVERLLVEDTLRHFGGHQRKTAESLGIGERTLRDKIKRWGLKVERRASVAQ